MGDDGQILMAPACGCDRESINSDVDVDAVASTAEGSHSLRLLVLLGLLLATQGGVLDRDNTLPMASLPEETKTAEVKQEVTNGNQETQAQLTSSSNPQDLPANPISEATKPVELKVTNENQATQTQKANSINAQVVQESQAPSDVIKPIEVVPEVTKESLEIQPISNEIPKDQELPKSDVSTQNLPNVQESQPQLVHAKVDPSDDIKSVEVAPKITNINQEVEVQEVQPTSNEIPKDQRLPKKEVVPAQNLPNTQGRSVQDLDKIFKYPEVQLIDGSLSSSNQYQNLYNKYQSHPKVEIISVVNTTTADANVTEQIRNQTIYYSNQKKTGFPFPFLPNPFEKLEQQQPIYINLNQTANSTGNVTYQTHIHGGTKPFPYLPNPFTDFPNVVGLSLVLLPNPFYVNKYQSQNVTGSQGNVTYDYIGKLRAFSEETQKEQKQRQQQSQKPNFYLIPNPLANQVSKDGQKGDANVVLPVNLAALPLLVPAPEMFQGKASSGSISFQDLIKATNVHVSQPLKLQANNGLSQIQKERAAIQQLILSHLSEQQKRFEKQSLGSGKSSQSAGPVGVVQEEEESSVLFAVEIPKPIYRFFKGIFGGFSK
ncbi:uncharacterized protein LOC119555513 [Drosophila subpulchrella]|uniref:uncharacterized protein LOC119555513 n=1 Tax=Drosophila subpulchrella TaxID=1486046 RepID=UPI0018A166B5|nr:uncharacterized protein LOC119555513 [Drosophila subpulchrella]